jgi:octopine/nopaline transport system substrate-binding protein
MRFTTLTALVAAMALTAGLAQAKDWKTVRIATEGAYAPWNFTDSSGKLVGFELDLAKDLCARMKVECEIVPQAWDGIIPALQAGKYDVIMAGMSITDERKKVISFSDAYAVEPNSFVVLKSSPLAGFKTEVGSIIFPDTDAGETAALAAIKAALKGKAVGAQVATTHENFLRQHLGDTVDIRTYDTQENLDLDLQAGRVDVALASMSYWKPLMASDKGKDFMAIGPGMNGGVFGNGVGAGIRQTDADLAAMFSKAIGEAAADGTLKKLAVQWFGFDVTPKE